MHTASRIDSLHFQSMENRSAIFMAQKREYDTADENSKVDVLGFN